MPERTPLHQIAALSAASHGIFTLSQWTACGLTDDQLAHAVRRGTVERTGGNGVYRFAGQPFTWRQRAAAGLAMLGEEACLSGQAAGFLLGLDSFRQPSLLEFAVPRNQRNRSCSGKVRSMASLRPVDVVERHGLRVLSASRLIVEEAGRWDVEQLTAAIESACRIGWTSELVLRRRLAELRSRGKEGVRALDRVLDIPMVESWLERRMLSLMRSAGIERPETQMRLASRCGGPVARVDFFWSARRVIVEVSGHRFHSSREQIQRDHQRHTELTLAGYRVLTFTYEDVTKRPSWTTNALESALHVAA